MLEGFAEEGVSRRARTPRGMRTMAPDSFPARFGALLACMPGVRAAVYRTARGTVGAILKPSFCAFRFPLYRPQKWEPHSTTSAELTPVALKDSGLPMVNRAVSRGA